MDTPDRALPVLRTAGDDAFRPSGKRRQAEPSGSDDRPDPPRQEPERGIQPDQEKDRLQICVQ
ncbi:hypothetical protein D3C87_2176930 [compost metagenome]